MARVITTFRARRVAQLHHAVAVADAINDAEAQDAGLRALEAFVRLWRSAPPHPRDSLAAHRR